MKKDIFDLEQAILNCWQVTDDVDNLLEQYLDHPSGMSEDDMANYLIGLKTIYGVKFNKLFSIFEEVCREYHSLKKGNSV